MAMEREEVEGRVHEYLEMSQAIRENLVAKVDYFNSLGVRFVAFSDECRKHKVLEYNHASKKAIVYLWDAQRLAARMKKTPYSIIESILCRTQNEIASGKSFSITFFDIKKCQP